MNPTDSPHPEQGPLFHPVSQKERIVLLDMLRGVAICGILLMNISFFGASVYTGDPRVMHEMSNPQNMRTWFVIYYLLEGSMRGLFSMLFGAGALLFISRLEKNEPGIRPAELYIRRLLWLLVFGLINGYVLNWPGDILYHYAIVGLMLIPFRKAPLKVIGILIIFFIGVTMLQAWLRNADMNQTRDKGIVAEKLEKEKKTLTEDQKAVVSNVARYHRKSMPKPQHDLYRMALYGRSDALVS